MSTQDHKSSKLITINIPYELKMKFINEDELHILTKVDKFASWDDGMPVQGQFSAGLIVNEVELNISNNIKCIEACYNWIDKIRKDSNFEFKYKITIGAFEGLYPRYMNNNKVIFGFDYYNESNKNWKDWFLKEDLICTPAAC